MANTKKGSVVKISLDKTITVSVITYKNHPLYKKRYIYSKKYLVHDPKSLAKIKDQVIIKKCKPISKRKHWILESVVSLKQIKPKEKKS